MPLLQIDNSDWLVWPWLPEVVFPLLLLEAAYLYAVTSRRSRLSDASLNRREVALFSFGVLVLYLATGSIVDHLADHFLLSAHALELVLITLVAMPLLIAGLPSWLLSNPLRSPFVLRAARLLTHPLVALAAYNSVLLLTHLPFFYEWALRNEGPHFLMHAMWAGAGLLLWWPILSPAQELPRLYYPLQMGYLFLQSLVPSVMASFITFADNVVYPFYEEAPRIWSMSAVTDQQIAGGLMKVLGSLILWSFIGVAFFRWYLREQAEAEEVRLAHAEEELAKPGF